MGLGEGDRIVVDEVRGFKVGSVYSDGYHGGHSGEEVCSHNFGDMFF